MKRRSYIFLDKIGFKPYYNWNTFNTEEFRNWFQEAIIGFKPYYNWNTFNTRR